MTRSKPGPVSKYHGYVTVSTIDGSNNCIKNLDKTELDGRVIGVEPFNQDKSKVISLRRDAAIKTPTSTKPRSETDNKADDRQNSGRSERTDVSKQTKEDERRPVKARLSVGNSRQASGLTIRDRPRPMLHTSRHTHSAHSYPYKISEHSRRNDVYEADRQQQSYSRLQEERDRERIRRKKRELEEEERQRQREKEKLKQLERKQREEATKLAHERERLKLERERLEREKLETERLRLYNERMEHQRLKRELEKQRRLDEQRIREDEDLRRRSTSDKRQNSYHDMHNHHHQQQHSRSHQPIHHHSTSRQTSSNQHSSPTSPPPLATSQQQQQNEHLMHDIILMNRDQASPNRADIIESNNDYYGRDPPTLSSSYIDSNQLKHYQTSTSFNMGEAHMFMFSRVSFRFH